MSEIISESCFLYLFADHAESKQHDAAEDHATLVDKGSNDRTEEPMETGYVRKPLAYSTSGIIQQSWKKIRFSKNHFRNDCFMLIATYLITKYLIWRSFCNPVIPFV